MSSLSLKKITPNSDGTLNTNNTPLAVSSTDSIWPDKNQAAFLTNGNYVITWIYKLYNGVYHGVYARMFDPTGKTIQVGGSHEFLVSTYTTNYQFSPAIAGLTNGGFVITWESRDESGIDIYAQIFDADGNKLCKTDSTGITDADKSVTQCYTGTATAKPADLLINTYTANHQFSQAITGLTNGGFVITWQSQGQDGSSHGIYAQIFDVDGNKLCKTSSTGTTDADKSVTQCYSGTDLAKPADLPVNTYTTNSQYNPAITGLTNGGFVIIWESYEQDGSSTGIYAQIFDAAGNKLCKTDSTGITDADKSVTQCYSGTATSKPADLLVNTYTKDDQDNPAITGLTNGGFVITWQSQGQDGSDYGIYAQIFDADGNKLCKTSSTGITDADKSITSCYTGTAIAKPADLQVNTYTKDDQLNRKIGALNDGNFIIVYFDICKSYCKVFDSAGQALMIEYTLELSSSYIISDSQNKLISYYQGGSNLIKADLYEIVENDTQLKSDLIGLLRNKAVQITSQNLLLPGGALANLASSYCMVDKCATSTTYDSSISGLYILSAEKPIAKSLETYDPSHQAIYSKYDQAVYVTATQGVYNTTIEGKYSTSTEKAVARTDACITENPSATDTSFLMNLLNIFNKPAVKNTIHSQLNSDKKLAKEYCVIDNCLTTNYKCSDPTHTYNATTQAVYNIKTYKSVPTTNICIIEKPTTQAVLDFLKNANVKTTLSTVLTKANLKTILPNWSKAGADKTAYDAIEKSIVTGLTKAHLKEIFPNWSKAGTDKTAYDAMEKSIVTGLTKARLKEIFPNWSKAGADKTAYDAIITSMKAARLLEEESEDALYDSVSHNLGDNYSLGDNSASAEEIQALHEHIAALNAKIAELTSTLNGAHLEKASIFSDTTSSSEALSYDDVMLVLGLSSITLVALWN